MCPLPLEQSQHRAHDRERSPGPEDEHPANQLRFQGRKTGMEFCAEIASQDCDLLLEFGPRLGQPLLQSDVVVQGQTEVKDRPDATYSHDGREP